MTGTSTRPESTVRLALAQMNTSVGDLAGNADLIVEWTGRAAALGADIVAFPEMAVTGYQVDDLALRSSFVEASRATLDGLAARLVEAGHGDVVAIADLDLDMIAEVRKTWQFFRDRRPETYGSLTEQSGRALAAD